MLEPGQIFAHRYRVNRRIAEGGMGAIFEAEHTATERKVALKLLFPHIMSVASARKKFELEAKISARVNSRNIVEVIDAGFDEATQSPFLVMELLDGQTLAQFVRDNGPFEVDQALMLLEQIAAGLDAAHAYREHNGVSKPIVHRDLKPENLFMAQDRGAYVMKILDFGIAKVLGETGNVSQEVRGTPLYMAFEQVTAGPLSPQTDVWALGLIAYYMLTGSHYWRAASQPSASVQSLFAEILSLPLEPPSVRMRQQNIPLQLPLAFDAWLLECVNRDSTRRFSSAGVAIAALARVFGTSIRPRPRYDSKPAPAPMFAATEAYEPPVATREPAPTREPAATREAAASRDAATVREPAAPREPVVSATSLSGVASERGPSLAPPRILQPKPWLGAAAGGALLLLGGATWLALRSDDPTSEATSSAAAAPSAKPQAEDQPRPNTRGLPRNGREAPVTSTLSTLSPRPVPKAEAALGAESGAVPSPTVGISPEPQIRIAPREEPVVAETVSEAPELAAETPAVHAAPPVNAGDAESAPAGLPSAASVQARRSSPATSPPVNATTHAASPAPRSLPDPGPAAPSTSPPAGGPPKAPASVTSAASGDAPAVNPPPAAKPSPPPAERSKKPPKNAEAYRIR